MKKEYAEYLLKKTKEDYNLIAEDFSRTRGQVWKELRFLEEYLISGEKVLDLGCGNGRLYELFKKKFVDYYGVDSSDKIIEIAKSRYPKTKFQVADALNLPFPENFFDKVISVAVFHHIPSKEFRLQFLNEIKRVLKPEGKIILLVWNLSIWKSPFSFLTEFLRSKNEGEDENKVFIAKNWKLDFGDSFIPWREEILRYVHRFSKNELKKLTEKVRFKVEEIKILKRPGSKESNILLIAEK